VILRSVDIRSGEQAGGRQLVPAWEAVSEAQWRRASGYWLIAQPDHAALAGDLAEEFACGPYPQLDEDIVRAFRLHDAGWTPLDGSGERGAGAGGARPMPAPRRHADGRPMSFLDFGPSDFLPAWNGSIKSVEQASGAIGGLLVSEHFARLARTRLDSGKSTPEETRMMLEFLDAQAAQQARWMAGAGNGVTPERVKVLTDALQFCDLLSLYLCCGSAENVSFPQEFGGQRPVLYRRYGVCQLEPSPFSDKIVVGVKATLDGPGEEKTSEFSLR
jgi:Protein of unknown function (DUF3891)